VTGVELYQLCWNTEHAERLPSSDPRFVRAHDFYCTEAELLDDDKPGQWLSDLVHPDVIYVMPTRASRLRGTARTELSGMLHFDDNYESMCTRVARLTSRAAWAEDPPSRTRRHITNLRAYREMSIDGSLGPADGVDRLMTRSYLLLVRSRWDQPAFELISCERFDVLTYSDGNLRLYQREIVVDQSCLGAINLAVFL
jgi:3-phenylpropionate/cinnamic acid dioxygenase small subunit